MQETDPPAVSIPAPGAGAHTLQSLIRGLTEYGDTVAIVALADDGPEWRCPYSELVEQADRVAGGLAARGIGAGDRVAMFAPSGPDWVVACLGVICAGATVVPLDASLRGDALTAPLTDSGCRAVFAGAAQVAPLLEYEAGGPLDIFVLGENTDRVGAKAVSWQTLQDGRQAPVVDRPTPDQPAALFYTSGTTGKPKGVPLSHANILADLDGLLTTRLADQSDRVLLPLPLHHVYPFTTGMLAPLAIGATIVFPAGLGGPEIARALREGRISVVIGVPRLLAGFAAAIEAGIDARQGAIRVLALLSLRASGLLRRRAGWRAPGRLLFGALRTKIAPHLRLLASGGARLDPSVAWTLEALGWEVLSGYGLTEASPILTFNSPGESGIGTAGRPLAGVELRIATPAGEPWGEIQARGPNIFAGYRNRPEETRDAFTDDGWLRTGDLGFLDADGRLSVVGRTKELIVLAGGENILPEEPEKAYAASPLIREIAVLEIDGGLVALVVPDMDAIRERGAERLPTLIHDELITRARGLPSYQRLSGHVILRGTLPRTALGKLRRHLLPDLYRHARTGGPQTPPAQTSEADIPLIESPLGRRVWRWLRDRFPGVELNLETSPQLDLGIDSLAWVGLGIEMEERFGIRMTEDRIARIVTVRDLLREAVAAAGESPSDRPAAKEELPRRGMAVFLLAILACLFNRAIMHLLFQVRIDGVERLPRTGPLVIAPNHTSYLDPLAVAAALPLALLPNTYYAGWTGMMFKGPVGRLFSRIANVIPVDPDRTAMHSIALAQEVLSRGGILVWFPEGIRSLSGTLQPLMPGVGALLEMTGARVVPVHIGGSFEAAPAGRVIPRLRPISIRFGKPWSPSDLAARGLGETARSRIVDGLQQTMADLAEGRDGK